MDQRAHEFTWFLLAFMLLSIILSFPCNGLCSNVFFSPLFLIVFPPIYGFYISSPPVFMVIRVGFLYFVQLYAFFLIYLPILMFNMSSIPDDDRNTTGSTSGAATDLSFGAPAFISGD